MIARHTRRAADAYREGNEAGYARALAWKANPNRGSSRVGGTLQYQVLELAERMRKAKRVASWFRAQGEIVGFCYAIECPEHADMLNRAAVAAKRDCKGVAA